MSTPDTDVFLLARDYLIEADGWRALPNVGETLDASLNTAFEYVRIEEGITFQPECEISFVLSDDEQIRALNSAHRGKDKATNVLSFPIDEEMDTYGPMLGDIVFAFETIEREASEMGLVFSAHLAHLCVHGFLHLLGYDHIEPDEAEKMESVEVAILSRLGLDNPYKGTVPLEMPK